MPHAGESWQGVMRPCWLGRLPWHLAALESVLERLFPPRGAEKPLRLLRRACAGASSAARRQSSHRLANDLEVALHGSPQQLLSLLVRDDLPASNRENELCRAPNVIQPLRGLRSHRGASVCGSLPWRSTDSGDLANPA